MKKLISSVIVAVMLSSTVAMAATTFAPTPQNETTTYTQTFDGEVTKETGWSRYGNGKNNVQQEIYNGYTVEVVKNPFEDSETSTDDVLQHLHDTSESGEGAKFTMLPELQMNERDIFTISFDAALKDADADKSRMQLAVKINDTTSISVFNVYSGGWTDGTGFMDTVDNYMINSPSANGFTHYEIIFDKGANKITYTSGNKTVTHPIKEGITINSVYSFTLATEHKSTDKTGPAYYINNMSYAVTRVPQGNVETFDSCMENSAWKTKTVQLPNAVYYINNMEKAESTQDIDPARGKVLKTSGWSNSGNYIAMPLDYTMDKDDVFTFSFDYANDQNNEGSLIFKLDDANAETSRSMSIKLTSVKGALYEGKESFDVTSSLFTISNGKIWMGNDWRSEGVAVLTPNQFSRITVVIDNSDDELENRRTLAIYVDGELYVTKWYMDDNDDTTNSRHITGVSLCYNQAYITRYFDNLWATLTENEIKVDGDTALYTYPVVYDNETEANFVVAYYDGEGSLINAEISSATPSDGRTVTAAISTPEGTAATKVFRWNNFTSLKPLSPVWDSTAQ